MILDLLQSAAPNYIEMNIKKGQLAQLKTWILLIISYYYMKNTIWMRNIKTWIHSILKQCCLKMIVWLFHWKNMEMINNSCLDIQINRNRKVLKSCLILKVQENFQLIMLNIAQGCLLILSSLHFLININLINKIMITNLKLILIN